MSNMDMDFSLDSLTWVNTEAVILESVRAHGTLKANIPVAYGTLFNYHEQQPSFGAYTGGDCGWRIPAKFIPADFLPLKPRDRVIDSFGRVFTVQSVQPSRHTSRGPQSWKLNCRDLSVAFDLRDLITIESPRRELDSTDAKRVLSWDQKYLLITSRVQLVEEQIVDEPMKRVSQGKYAVFLDREVTVTHEDRIKWIPGLVRDPATHALAAPDLTDVRYLEIVTYRNPESIQELPVIDARSTP